MSSLVIIGGGAAGMMAAVTAAERGIQVTLIERNDKLGKKLYITGKGRCNLCNCCETEEFFKNVVSNPKFLYSSVYGFTPDDTIAFFNGLGLETKVERGNRVFPVSDKSSDVIRALADRISELGVDVRLNTCVTRIDIRDGRFDSVLTDKYGRIAADRCFVATGGLSYPSTGSTGDGFRFARELGHKVTRLIPSLVSVKTQEQFVKQLEGLSLKNVVLTARVGGKVKHSELGEMLFTHDGISGPLVLSISSLLGDDINDGRQVTFSIDLKPGLDKDKLDERVLKDFGEFSNRVFANSLVKLLPSSIIPVVVQLSGIDPDKRVNAVTKQEREQLVGIIKGFPLTALRLGSYNEAVVTKGGVSVREIDPSTMESKLIGGLHFIGEVLDLDAFTGGYNLQIAWSTARAAANSADI